MARILAIDYGRKRVGLAVTDELKIIATPLGTVHSEDVITYLKRYIRDNPVECLVVGEPKDMANRPSEAERYITPFIRNLKKAFPEIRIERFDERFTSRMASRAILEAGAKKSDRQNKALVDAVSATLILQSYLESKEMKS
ncbi:MAG: Holliday junction resolvase RuvX [Bacteroidetes bacterium]|nr:MAG: Holliday junction resolvase RuvX [Bacteroidota bacterium]